MKPIWPLVVAAAVASVSLVLTLVLAIVAIWTHGADSARWGGTSAICFTVLVVSACLTGALADSR